MTPKSFLPADEDCPKTGLPMAFCSHCTGDDEREAIEAREEREYLLKGWPFLAQFPGRCAVDEDHPVKKGSKVSRVIRADNPLLTVPGVACTACVRDLDKMQE